MKAHTKTKPNQSSKGGTSEPENPEQHDDPPKKNNKGSVKDLKKRLLGAASNAFDDDKGAPTKNSDDEAADELDDASGLRDRSKANKFDRLLGKGEIPSEIVDMLNEGMKNSKNPRSFKTELINKLFNRDDTGKLVMCPQAPFFTAWKQSQVTKSMTHKETAFPKTVFIGKFFNNSVDAFNHSLAVGDVEMVEVNGREFYSFVSLENAHTRAKVATQKVVQHEKKIDAAQCRHLSEAFDSLQFNFKKICVMQPLTDAQNSASVSSSQSGPSAVAVEVQPPMTGDEVFEKMKNVF